MTASHSIVPLVATIVGLVLIAAGTMAFAKRFRLPFTVLLVVVGIILSFIARSGPHLFRPLLEYSLSPGLILFVFLPTLLFESAINLDARQLRTNLMPIITLAVPGLIVSTAVIGTIVAACTPLALASAFLLGAILSATDPVAVVSLFKQLGAPRRLTVLVEGESLFNDATSMVVARILMGAAVTGYLTGQAAMAGLADFMIVFVGGVLVGWLAAMVVGLVLGLVESDPFIEISLTTVLAYVSFMLAEEVFHVSGVMATVTAGVILGSWGKTKISPSITVYLDHFWEYLATLANGLIFLLVGLRVDLAVLVDSFDLLPWVILAMLVSRAVVVYGLMPLVGRLPGEEPVGRSYKTVIFWGGLRGAVALAIVMSLERSEYTDTLVALVTGAVLFTLLVQGLTIETLVRWLGLDQLVLADRVARAEGILAAKQQALEMIPRLQAGGMFSAHIAQLWQQRCIAEIESQHQELDELRNRELGRQQEQLLLLNRCLAEEKKYYYQLFSDGHLSETIFRDLSHSLELQMDALRQGMSLPRFTLHSPHTRSLLNRIVSWRDRLFRFTPLPEFFQQTRIALDYERAWGRYRGSIQVFKDLDRLARLESVPAEVAENVRLVYRQWCDSARARLDGIAAQFPEFAVATQERLAGRLLVHVQEAVIDMEQRVGTLPRGVADSIRSELAGQVHNLRGRDLTTLHVEPTELLLKVPFFKKISESECGRVIDVLRPHTFSMHDVIIRQGDQGDSMFLISRGVVRISRQVNGEEQDLATMMAGDFFGEMALLHREPRTATCRAVTPCVLYELRRQDFDEARRNCPAIEAAIVKADQQRAAALQQQSAQENVVP